MKCEDSLESGVRVCSLCDKKKHQTQSFSCLIAAVVTAVTVTSEYVSPPARGDVRGGRMHSERCGKPTT